MRRKLEARNSSRPKNQRYVCTGNGPRTLNNPPTTGSYYGYLMKKTRKCTCSNNPNLKQFNKVKNIVNQRYSSSDYVHIKRTEILQRVSCDQKTIDYQKATNTFVSKKLLCAKAHVNNRIQKRLCNTTKTLNLVKPDNSYSQIYQALHAKNYTCADKQNANTAGC